MFCSSIDYKALPERIWIAIFILNSYRFGAGDFPLAELALTKTSYSGRQKIPLCRNNPDSYTGYIFHRSQTIAKHITQPIYTLTAHNLAVSCSCCCRPFTAGILLTSDWSRSSFACNDRTITCLLQMLLCGTALPQLPSLNETRSNLAVPVYSRVITARVRPLSQNVV